MSLAALRQRIATVSDLLCTLNLIVWDSRTMMPSGGAAARGHQIATLTRMARDTLAADATMDLLARAEDEAAGLPADDLAHEELRQIRRAAELHRRVPAELIERRAAVRAAANAAWIEARARSDFSLFAPLLEETVANTRAYADAIGWEAHPYDAMIGLYEPGETLASLQRLFGALRDGIRPILDAALARPQAQAAFVPGAFPADRQWEAAKAFSARFGFDFGRGRLDTTVHPFEISFTRDDVRITTRYNPADLRPALFGAFHETGHGLYEQNVDPAFTRTVFASDLVGLYAVGGTSFGAHESQSRLWENHVGRSRRFWELNFAELQGFFPDALANVTPEAFYDAVTGVRKSLIRVEADELTYDLHIMLRVEIEAALMDGSLKVADVPGAWADAMQRHLGLTPPGDREGVLQDIHWSSGMIGSFCTYTVGNVMAAQLYAAAKADPGVAAGVAAGDYAPLAGWLRRCCWTHGRSKTRDAILQDACGRGLDAGAYLAHLRERYAG
ncbi:carboxypeptidase M32 [Alsobacter metallidurans]|uniref:Metal-dependent carboxypeptidase n=1 Tax=Alsobacter metallidurans TaxID=340221 RepID=A0A917I8D6_9HYPH|nr:carboxypeptidase M32 [Alsobacter metallidurans]GGH23619.1 carboxypeptidase M32 [Alsobacter metallidurans]